MRIAAAAALLLLALGLSVQAAKDEGRQEISTSLRLKNVTIGRKPGKSGTGLTGNSTIEARSLLVTSDNATREPDKILPEDEANGELDEDKPEELPEALELRYVLPGKPLRRRPYYASPTRRSSLSNRRNVYPGRVFDDDKPQRPTSRPARRPSDPKRAPSESECTFFSTTVCLKAADYPMEAIIRSIRNNKEMVAALLTDFKEVGIADEDDVPTSGFHSHYDNRFDKRYENPFETSNEIKRKYEFKSAYENTEEGFTCPSLVKYAQPQLARAASGVWKYIINTGEHTQTVRLEKCLNVGSSCSFISENYRSSCQQVYNYHRLLTWDSKLGLHMDIFKVPTCCSCHIRGYTDLFPPHQTDPPLKPQETFPGVDFATTDHHVGKGSSHINKYTNSLDSSALNLFRDSYGSTSGGGSSDSDEQQLQHSSSARRPSVARPPRRKPGSSSASRPFDKLPQQHAPNTRAPGYKGPRPSHRPNRPFRRESVVQDTSDFAQDTTNITITRYSQALDQDSLEPSLRLQNGGFDDEYQEQPSQRRINYNYHPIIDFFKPEMAMLKSEEPMQASASAPQHDSWKPIFKA